MYLDAQVSRSLTSQNRAKKIVTVFIKFSIPISTTTTYNKTTRISIRRDSNLSSIKARERLKSMYNRGGGPGQMYEKSRKGEGRKGRARSIDSKELGRGRGEGKKKKKER